MGPAQEARCAGAGIAEWEELRDLASGIKEHTLTHLADYLEEFETQAEKPTAWSCTGRRTPRSTTQIVHELMSSAA